MQEGKQGESGCHVMSAYVVLSLLLFAFPLLHYVAPERTSGFKNMKMKSEAEDRGQK